MSVYTVEGIELSSNLLPFIELSTFMVLPFFGPYDIYRDENGKHGIDFYCGLQLETNQRQALNGFVVGSICTGWQFTLLQR